MAATRLTIGMATHRDFDGVYFTLNALRLYHADVLPRCEIVVVDNDPDGPQAEQLRGFMGHVAARHADRPHPFQVQYVPYRETTGTAAPRNHVFEVAQGDAVLVLDSHVNLWPGAVGKLLHWYDAHPDGGDLVQGPLVYDDLTTISTHFADMWRDGMWGTWGTDPRGCDPEAPAFEIPAQGLGLFSCRKEAWPGFNPHFREFGGEEWYIHEKFRQRGRRCLCLPFLRWVHRFSAPAAGRAYQFTVMGKIRNYLLGLQELGLPLDRLRRHYVEGLNEDPNNPINRDAHLTAEQFEALAHETIRYPIQLDSETGDSTTRQANGDPRANDHSITLDELYRLAAHTPSDINEHCAKLRELASQCETVVEFGMRHGVSTVALLAGQPKSLLTVAPQFDAILDDLRARSGKTSFEFRHGTSLDTEAPECDLLFIDSKHTADHLARELERHASRVRRWMAFHDTDIYGEHGEDGSPGLLPALRAFLERDPVWRVVHHARANHGLTVVSRHLADTALDPCPITGLNITAGWTNSADSLSSIETMSGQRNGQTVAQGSAVLLSPDSRRSERPSFVVGNSWQLHQLSAAERTALDREPFVLVCNLFPEYWRSIGFRPTVWIWGDTHNEESCELMAGQLECICRDDVLRERLQRMFVCVESPLAREILDNYELPITRYQRGDWSDRSQSLAASLTGRVYHFGSTLTDVVNLALLLNPEQEIRLCGCQYGNRFGHFYQTTGGLDFTPSLFPVVIERMWQGFSDLGRQGIPLVDCNFEHGPQIPPEYRLPRRTLLE